MIEKQWILPTPPPEDQIEKLSGQLNINPILTAVIMNRGIDTFAKARSFFRPSLGDLHDPFLMKDMDKAVERVSQAINANEKVLIYGDYDVDGTTSVAMALEFFSRYTDCEYYIPDRYKEGYGVSQQGIDHAINQRFTLVISLDCGISAYEQVARAKKHGIDFIICDHHNPGTKLPPAVAILDPKQPDCNYPFRELSGCGVGFKLLQGLCLHRGIDQDELIPYLDLLAVSIGADIVPMTGENRIFAQYGLKRLNGNPRPGLQALMELKLNTRKVDISGIVFGIAPRINAAGRIAHAKLAVQLLISKDIEEARHLARKLNVNNDLRRNYDKQITEEALAMIEEDIGEPVPKATVLFKKDWHKGVVGIVASRCLEKYYRPTVILTGSNGMATGSARSVEGFNLYEAIAECKDLLENFGGHKYAAGLTLRTENIPRFKERFQRVVAEQIRDEQLIPRIYADHELGFEHIYEKFYNIMSQMAPFGPGNLQPVFISRNVHLRGLPRIIKETHLKVEVADDDGRVFEAIGFGLAEKAGMMAKSRSMDIAYQVEMNHYNGATLQLNLKDVRFDGAEG